MSLLETHSILDRHSVSQYDQKTLCVWYAFNTIYLLVFFDKDYQRVKRKENTSLIIYDELEL